MDENVQEAGQRRELRGNESGDGMSQDVEVENASRSEMEEPSDDTPGAERRSSFVNRIISKFR